MKIELLDLRDEILEWCTENKTGKEKLVILSSGDDPASEVYMKNKLKIGEQLDIPTIHIRCESQSELESKIQECNQDDGITGVIVQLPLPTEYDSNYFINLIKPSKDVDMLTDVNKADMFLGKTTLLPATASGVIEILNKFCTMLRGKDVLLIGRSDLVNIPLQKALLDKDCTVTTSHSKTINLAEKIRNSNIVISAAGCPNLIGCHCVSNKTELIIDVSINRVEGKIKGDVVNKVYDLVDVTSNPRGCGALTVPMLFKNLVKITREELF